MGQPNRLSLTAVDTVEAEPAPLDARTVKPPTTEDARAVGNQKRRNNEIAGLELRNVSTHLLDDANQLVPHPPPRLARLHRLVRPKVTAADRGSRDTHKRIMWLHQTRIRHVLDSHIARRVHHSCAHNRLLSPPPRPTLRPRGTTDTRTARDSLPVQPLTSYPQQQQKHLAGSRRPIPSPSGRDGHPVNTTDRR